MNISKQMQDLRDALDKANVEWLDLSDEFKYGNGDLLHMERTKFCDPKGFEVSVVYGYMRYAECPPFGKDVTIGSSYGYPGLMECWHKPTYEDPTPMELAEILRIAGAKE